MAWALMVSCFLDRAQHRCAPRTRARVASPSRFAVVLACLSCVSDADKTDFCEMNAPFPLRQESFACDFQFHEGPVLERLLDKLGTRIPVPQNVRSERSCTGSLCMYNHVCLDRRHLNYYSDEADSALPPRHIIDHRSQPRESGTYWHGMRLESSARWSAAAAAGRWVPAPMPSDSIFSDLSAHADGERRGAASLGTFESARVLGVRRRHAPRTFFF